MCFSVRFRKISGEEGDHTPEGIVFPQDFSSRCYRGVNTLGRCHPDGTPILRAGGRGPEAEALWGVSEI